MAKIKKHPELNSNEKETLATVFRIDNNMRTINRVLSQRLNPSTHITDLTSVLIATETFIDRLGCIFDDSDED